MPTKPEQTPEQRSMRLRGYELYLATDQDGRRRSLRAIAMSLGVTLGAIQYWRRVDKWDQRVGEALKDRTAATGASGQALGALLRQSLFEHIDTLNSIIRDKNEKPAVRLAAIRELADITIKLKVIDPSDLMATRPKADLTFKDNLSEPTQDGVQPADHLLPGADEGHHDNDPGDGQAWGGPSPERSDAGDGWSSGNDPSSDN